ncbi:MAG TPA: NADH-quinone oxidoreductase subunit J [Deferrisomatales bacterium]|nr:NADH-quinone oxidoreductase subunit J [Deferrisomatales bacterium]
MPLILFFLFGGLAVAAAVGVLVCRNPLHSAMCMIGTMVSLAAIYLLHHAEFIFVIQIMVYAGAVMMLVVFVIMLLDLEKEERTSLVLTPGKFVALALGGLLAVLLLLPLTVRMTGVSGDMTVDALVAQGSVEFLADKLFSQYLLPFEVASVLLLVGLVGAVTLAKKKL